MNPEGQGESGEVRGERRHRRQVLSARAEKAVEQGGQAAAGERFPENFGDTGIARQFLGVVAAAGAEHHREVGSDGAQQHGPLLDIEL